MDNSRLKELFLSHYNRTATSEQRAELMKLLNEVDPKQIELLILELGEKLDMIDEVISPGKSEKILLSILEKKQYKAPVHRMDPVITNPGLVDNSRRSWMRWIAAASIVMIIGLGGYYFFSGKREKQMDIVQTPVIHEEIKAPTSNRATITLANGQQVYLDSFKSGTIALEGFVQVNKLADGQIVYIQDQMNSKAPVEKLIYNTLTNPRGSRVIDMTLADGSRVWLNAGSSLTFPVSFAGNDRQVSITGEAYLEIKEDKLKPFKVLFNETQVEVLGTQFNINAYEDEPDTKTTLLEGSIKISTPKEFKILKPGNQAVVDGGDMQIVNKVNVGETIAWKNGFFEFNNADIETLLRQSARWYDIEVAYQGNKPADRFTGKISRSVNLSEFLKVLEYSEVHFKMEGRKLKIMP